MLDVSGRKLQLTWWVWACGLPAPPLLDPGSSADTAFPALHTLPHFCPSGSTGQVEQVVKVILGALEWELRQRPGCPGFSTSWSGHITCSLAHHVY